MVEGPLKRFLNRDEEHIGPTLTTTEVNDIMGKLNSWGYDVKLMKPSGFAPIWLRVWNQEMRVLQIGLHEVVDYEDMWGGIQFRLSNGAVLEMFENGSIQYTGGDGFNINVEFMR